MGKKEYKAEILPGVETLLEEKEDVGKELSELETLRQIKKNVQEEVSRLQIIVSNLLAQKHSLEIKESLDDRLADGEKFNKFAAEERRIEIKRIEAEKRIDTAEICERKLNDRTIEIERREQKTMNLEDLISDLNKQRANFEIYKTSVNDQLESAKITIVEANASFEKIGIERQMLAGRERVVGDKEKYWNDLIGKLEEDKKEFQIEKENFIGLGKIEKEVIND